MYFNLQNSLSTKPAGLWHGEKEKKTAKGVKRKVVEFDLRHQCYKESLENNCIKHCSMNQIRSYNHELFSVEINKIGLSPFDDKRYVLENGYDTLAHGHYKIKL